ncbi:chlororespiratory reduction protein 7 [Pseudanabaena sp. FACHB-2040]|uniref:chlororespiratory reduction protein 7 n=1 Tax=Pseudanabaena sp. FACHB-2040 TaxID=2692859 RepID=UPI0016828610|nr:chlororespiratory reduction protein 7 [Pseudanabaena sp. FACHB-2040]MBD0266832.1 chlororespiratory reduction protein 7 [Cyanobacteria bacterium Co-bin8]MBD2258989.1 chlororespiratory reduction protein 7 [Pseudanabaena sp. FACHB-2040]
MPDALMFDEEMYVVLVPGEEEVFLTPEELLDRLTALLQDRQSDLPRDLQKFQTLEEQATHLRDTACDFELRPGEQMQWYVVRLEK